MSERSIFNLDLDGGLLQWFVFLGGPINWAIQLLVSYFLISVTCGVWSETTVRLLLHIVSGAMLLLTLLALVLSLLILRYRSKAEDPLGEPEGRSEFMGASGALNNFLFIIVIAGSWVGVFFLSPC